MLVAAGSEKARGGRDVRKEIQADGEWLTFTGALITYHNSLIVIETTHTIAITPIPKNKKKKILDDYTTVSLDHSPDILCGYF